MATSRCDPAPTWEYSKPRLIKLERLLPDGTYAPPIVVVELDFGAQDFCQRHGIPYPPPPRDPA